MCCGFARARVDNAIVEIDSPEARSWTAARPRRGGESIRSGLELSRRAAAVHPVLKPVGSRCKMTFGGSGPMRAAFRIERRSRSTIGIGGSRSPLM